jgi:uncharacterized protein (DUF362 family)
MPKVAIVKGNAYDATVKALALTKFKELAKGKQRIVIKPNLVVPIHSSKGITTDVNVVKAVLDCLPKPEKAVIADGSDRASETFEINGYDKLAEEYGIKIIDLNKENEWAEIAVKNPMVFERIKMARRVVESDFLISVGKLKIHSVAVITGSLKNLMGTCPKDYRLKIHAFIPNSLVDLLSAKMPDFGLIDGMVANEIDENVPYPVKMDIVLASGDCFALDATAAKVIGIDWREVPFLQLLSKSVSFNPDEVDVLGEKIEDVERKFRRKKFNLRSSSQSMMTRALMGVGAFDYFYHHILPYIIKINRKFKIF